MIAAGLQMHTVLNHQLSCSKIKMVGGILTPLIIGKYPVLRVQGTKFRPKMTKVDFHMKDVLLVNEDLPPNLRVKRVAAMGQASAEEQEEADKIEKEVCFSF
jgi:hypothetical protein